MEERIRLSIRVQRIVGVEVAALGLLIVIIGIVWSIQWRL